MSLSQEQFDCLMLARSPRIGPVSYRQLIARFGSASAALKALPDLARRGGGKAKVADPRTVEREVNATIALGANYVFLGSAIYPSLLSEIDTAPPALIMRGRLDLLERHSVAMVGARNASAAACRFARMLAHDLGQGGYVTVSGLARGIDTAAHAGSLDSGTIAVIASGIDLAFPPENTQLQERIAQDGLLIAEQPPGTQPLARNFPSRNRIIAGLAQGTVVVEAAPRSGSLITARLAAECGRDVMAVPGSPLDPRAQGCNLLIREGATLIQTASDIIECLGPIGTGIVRQGRASFAVQAVIGDVSEVERDHVCGLLGPVPVQIDELVRQSGCAPAQVQLVLLELELAGRVERHAGGRVSLA